MAVIDTLNVFQTVPFVPYVICGSVIAIAFYAFYTFMAV